MLGYTKPVPSVPHVLIEYIQSDKGQYLDLGLLWGNTQYKVELDFLLPTPSNAQVSILGSRNDTPSTARFGSLYFGSTNVQGVWVGSASNRLPNTFVSMTRYLYSVEVFQPSLQLVTELDGVVRTSTYTGLTDTGIPVYLFGANLNDNIVERSAIRMYGFKSWSNNVLIRDMVPVLDMTNRPALWDKVNDVYYYNQGTGEFTYV